ncbi:hypothetical protein FHL15_009560 [Xylaria flabelliformis]|uniref:Uncharacterized protein n=1 Tax=Xylaria flabelliformis TaxID=2512241 RepID=A0A553HNL2_9PEZI|nr:hypothetical protein FHL15_009560 [Xylaria flabelliformis]
MSDKEGSTANSADGELKLTPQESKFFAVIFKHLPKTLDIDWEQFAAEMGFKNGDVAKVRCRQIRVKHGIYGAPGATSKSTAPKITKPANANNGVSKPRKQPKPKQPKVVAEVSDHTGYDKDNVNDAQNEEI